MNVYTDMPIQHDKSMERVKLWFQGEDSYQFAKNKQTHGGNPQASRDYILGAEIQNKWSRFQIFLGQGVYLQASQCILKACAAARGALVWQYVIDGEMLESARSLTWTDLDTFYESVRKGVALLHDFPTTKIQLQGSLPVNVESARTIPEIRSVYIGLSGLAIAYFAGPMEPKFPEPGVSSGEIKLWQSHST